ncbi:YdcF family protein [Paenibacillus nanensis]|uniref:YdcF family protein n=1 Tax=Paenibacillus nanensis TaxID=393251 RepID=A0A3A1UYB0_9BACL|nr:YdcF family protein [Paenibacillus nanensis]
MVVPAGLFIWFVFHTALVAIDGLNDEIKPVDAAVVLGNKVEGNGQPSKRLQARLDKSAELYDKGYFPLIIVSGGIGKEGFDEAKVMKAYLIDQGIPEEKIIEDNKGYNSYMTAQNARKLMDELQLDSVMIVTQYFHVSRTKLAFKKMDISEVYSAHADFFESRDFYSTLREFPAYYKYLLFK